MGDVVRHIQRPSWVTAVCIACVAITPASLRAGFAVFQAGFENRGSAWIDYDQDGYVDFYDGQKVWRNNNGTSFTQVASFGSGQSKWADFDNDGYPDVFSGNWLLHRNEGGGGSFTQKPFPGVNIVQSLDNCLVDIDGSGYVDIYMTGYEGNGYEPDVLARNQGNFQFDITWEEPPVAPDGVRFPGRGVTACDFDEDGDMDLYVSNYRLEANYLWLNNGSGGIVDVAASRGVHGTYDGWRWSYGHTIGSCWGDMNNDGYFDIFTGNFSHADAWQDRARFYRNLGPGDNWNFEQEWALTGSAWEESYASPSLADYDNDGDLDLYFSTVYAGDNARLWRNNGNWHFTDVTGSEGLAGMPETYQSAWADFNNDGFLDLATGGSIYRNLGNGNHWLKVRLEGNGTTINRSAIGAQVRIDLGGGVILTRQVEAGTGQGNQNDLTLHFGLGSQTSPLTLQIFWPDGTTQSVQNVAVDQTVTQVPAPATPDEDWTSTGFYQVGNGAEQLAFDPDGFDTGVHYRVVTGNVLPPAGSSQGIGEPGASNTWNSSGKVNWRASSTHGSRTFDYALNGFGIKGNGTVHSNMIFGDPPPASGQGGTITMGMFSSLAASLSNPRGGTVPGGHWVEFAFDRLYSLGEVWIWNQNENSLFDGNGSGTDYPVDAWTAQGIREVTIQATAIRKPGGSWGSDRPTDWITVFAGEVPQAFGREEEPVSLAVDFDGLRAQYVVITTSSDPARLNWALNAGLPGVTDAGFSEVRFLFPQPAIAELQFRDETLVSYPSSSGQVYGLDRSRVAPEPPPLFIGSSGSGWSTTSGVSVRAGHERISPPASDSRRAMDTVNGSGLHGGGDVHGSDQTTMWMSLQVNENPGNVRPGTVPGAHWIEFAFDRAYPVDEMLIWNYAEGSGYQWAAQGMRRVTIQSTTVGNGSGWGSHAANSWTTVFDGELDVYDPGQPQSANNTVSFNGVLARYVVLTSAPTNNLLHSWAFEKLGIVNFDAGLSEVRFTVEQVKSPVFAEGENVRALAIRTIPGLHYLLEKTASPIAPEWTDAGYRVIGNGEVRKLCDLETPGDGLIYRVRVD